MALRLRDLKRPPPISLGDIDNRIDTVIARVDGIHMPDNADMRQSIEDLRQEVAALKAARSRPWVFDVKRDATGRIIEITAKQGREGLI